MSRRQVLSPKAAELDPQNAIKLVEHSEFREDGQGEQQRRSEQSVQRRKDLSWRPSVVSTAAVYLLPLASPAVSTSPLAAERRREGSRPDEQEGRAG